MMSRGVGDGSTGISGGRGYQLPSHWARRSRPANDLPFSGGRAREDATKASAQLQRLRARG